MAELLRLRADDYHADQVADVPTLSASIAKILLTKSPAHAFAAHPKLNKDWKHSETTPAMDFGTAIHSLFLEGDASKIRVVMAKDWRTSAAQVIRDEARAEGLVPILDKDMVRVEAVVGRLYEQCRDHDVRPALFNAGSSEQTLVWNEGGVACRSRIDWLRDDRLAIDDLKTTSLSANPLNWARQLYSMHYDLQAAFYLRALRAVAPVGNFDADHTAYRLAIIETEPPYALSVMALSPAGLALANAKVDRALLLWKQCLETGKWPGYSQRVAYADPPAWAEEQFWASVDGDQA